MRRLAAVGLALLALAALVPEFQRYAAERALHRLTGVFQLVLAEPRALRDPRGALAWVASSAGELTADVRGDWRPLNLAAAALLVAERYEAALARYREVTALGERPEVDMNLGRAWAGLGRHERATTAFLRAGWVSPALLSTLPRETRQTVEAEVRRLEAALLSGRLTAPPPLPSGN